MEDVIYIISILSPHLKHEFSYPQQSYLVSNVASILDSSFSEHKGPPPPEWEASAGKGKSLNHGGYVYQFSGHHWKANLLQAAGVPNQDVAIITGAGTSSSEEPGTSTGG